MHGTVELDVTVNPFTAALRDGGVPAGQMRTAQRIRRHEGAVYLFADFWLDEPHPETGRRHIGVWYAAADSNGTLRWTPTVDGVAFADIEPLIPAGDGRDI